MLSARPADFEVPEGHHPKGTTLREALRGNLPLMQGLFEGSAGSLRRSAGSAAVRRILRGY